METQSAPEREAPAAEAKPAKESSVEAAKRASRHLRGTIAETLRSEATYFGKDDEVLLKFHGVYQQEDREKRTEERRVGGRTGAQFMVRVAIPGGVLEWRQYLDLDGIADRHAGEALRVTSRQGIQFHGILKGELQPAIAAVNDSLLTTLSACGDVGRNVMASPAPLADPAHALVERTAREIAAQLRPRTRAYREIWLGEEKVASTEEKEPFYGETYLPRKFKTGVAFASDASIDLHSYDCGLAAVLESGRVKGFNVVVGGGMGMTHRKADTFAALAQPLGFVDTENAVEAVRTVAAIFRDHGNRADRRHARLKYLIDEWGIERFRAEFRRRASFELKPSAPAPFPVYDDWLGRRAQGNGRWSYGVYLPSGRISDRGPARLKTALRILVERHRPRVRLTPGQNILLTDLDPAALPDVEATLRAHNAPLAEDLSSARRYSLACPALPTCGLALTDSERVLPAVQETIEAELAQLGLRDVPIAVRMTGCPNGCARPYTADLALVGRRPGVYHLFVGGGLRGDRMADLYAADVPLEDLAGTVRPLFAVWARERRDREGLGDWYVRRIGRAEPRRKVTGDEAPTIGALGLGAAP